MANKIKFLLGKYKVSEWKNSEVEEAKLKNQLQFSRKILLGIPCGTNFSITCTGINGETSIL